MHDSQQPKPWHRRPSLRAVLPAKHGMLWGKQRGKQETVLEQKILPQHFFPHYTTALILSLTRSLKSPPTWWELPPIGGGGIDSR